MKIGHRRRLPNTVPAPRAKENQGFSLRPFACKERLPDEEECPYAELDRLFRCL